MMSSLLNWLRPRRGTIVNRAARRKKTLKLYLETLEDRTVPTAIAPPSGMVSWWAGDNSGVDLVGGNNATLYNGAAFDTGKVASGFRFDGVDDNLQAPTVGLPIGSANRTIELWARVDQQQATGENFFASYGSPGSTNQVYTLGRLVDGRAFVSTWGPGLSGGQIAADGSWHHIAATNVGTSFNLYLDGVNVASGTVAVATPAGSTFWMGRETMSSFGDDRKLNGMVDEVSVYNRALSAAEIQGIYNAGPDGKIKTASNFVTADSPTVGEPPAGSTSTVTFTINRVGDLVGQTTVNWSTADGTATAATDYVAASGQVVFQNGEAQKTVTITVNGDDLLETPNETFNLVLATPTPGYTVRGAAQATILEPVTVQGHVYEDLNGNGVFDTGEGLAGWTVFLDGSPGAPLDTAKQRPRPRRAVLGNGRQWGVHLHGPPHASLRGFACATGC